MKKFLAILTVMTMVLTTLVVPTVAFGTTGDGNGNSARLETVSISPAHLGNLYIVTDSNGNTTTENVCAMGSSADFSFDGNKWRYNNVEVIDIFVGTDTPEKVVQRANVQWEIKVDNGAPEGPERFALIDSIMEHGTYPEENFFIQATEPGFGSPDDWQDPTEVPCEIFINNLLDENITTAAQYITTDFVCNGGETVKISINFSGLNGEINDVWFVDEDGGIVEPSYENGVYTVEIIPSTNDINNVTYVFRVDTNTGLRDYEFRPTDSNYQSEEYIIPDNQIIIHYQFYDEEGLYNFYPVTVDLPENHVEIGTLVGNNSNKVSDLHHEGLNCTGWAVEQYGPDSPSENDEIKSGEGGFIIGASAVYENDQTVIQTEISYYDANGNKQCDKETVVVDDDCSGVTDYIVDQALSSQLNAIAHYGNTENNKNFDYWNYDRGASLREYGYGGNRTLEIKAVYKEQPLHITCAYRDSEGNTVTLSDDVLLDKTTGEDIYGAFEAFLIEKNIPNIENVKGWAFNTGFGQAFDELGDEITVAAIYDQYKPSYVRRCYLKCELVDNKYEYYAINGNCGIPQDPDVIYVESDEFPESFDNSGPLVDGYSQKVYEAVGIAFANEPCGDLDLQGYRMEGADINPEIVKETASYDYRYAPFYDMMAIYNKAYVEVVMPNGEVKGTLWNPNKKYKIDEGNPGDLWEKTTIASGGTSIPNGSEVPIDPLHTTFSMWKIKQSPLKSEGIQEALKERTLAETSCEADEIQSECYDVKLLKPVAQGSAGAAYVPVTKTDFPKEGVWIMFEYPDGADKNTGIVITHMINANDPDNIEIITENTPGRDKKPRLIKTERGIKVKMYSLSPIAVSYGDALNSGNVNQGGSTDPGNTGNGTAGSSSVAASDKSAATGDDFSAIPYIAVMAIALAGVAAAMFRRKTVK